MLVSADSGCMQAATVLCCVADTGPCGAGLGLAPAQFADG